MKTRLIVITIVGLMVIVCGCKKNPVATKWQEAKTREASDLNYRRQKSLEEHHASRYGVYDSHDGKSREYLEWDGKTYEHIHDSSESRETPDCFHGFYVEVAIRRGDPNNPLKGDTTKPFSRRISDVKYRLRDDGVMAPAKGQ
jgi:hypothetical protein